MIQYVINLSPDTDAAGASPESGNLPQNADARNTTDPAIGSGDMTALVNGDEASAIGDESGAGAGAGIGNTVNPQTQTSTVGEIALGGTGDITKTNIGQGDKVADSASAMINNTGLDSPEASNQEDTDLSTGTLDADAATG